MDEASFAGVAERLRWWMGIVVVASLSVEGDLMGAGFEMDSTREGMLARRKKAEIQEVGRECSLAPVIRRIDSMRLCT